MDDAAALFYSITESHKRSPMIRCHARTYSRSLTCSPAPIRVTGSKADARSSTIPLLHTAVPRAGTCTLCFCDRNVMVGFFMHNDRIPPVSSVRILRSDVDSSGNFEQSFGPLMGTSSNPSIFQVAVTGYSITSQDMRDC